MTRRSAAKPLQVRERAGLPEMFSAASFFDVIDAGTGTHVSYAQRSKGHPPIVAFYGFRGGAGRSVSLAHVAAILARRGSHVAAMDLDLEAPGLHVLLDVVPSPLGGTAELVRDSALGRPIDPTPFVFPSPLAEGSRRLLVVPAGTITPTYLAVLEELGVSTWHATERPNPIRRVANALLQVEPKLDVVLVDCRTGFSGMSASILFHVADIVFAFLPLSDQVWDGVSVILQASKSAQSIRGGVPQLFMVPTMVPAGKFADEGLRAFEKRLIEAYESHLGVSDVEDSEDPDRPSWLLPAIRYDGTLALTGSVETSLRNPSGAMYNPLVDVIESTFAIGRTEPVAASLSQVKLEPRKILNEIRIDANLAFGDLPDLEMLKTHFVRPSDYDNVVHRATSVVVGAKGAGKTWLWRYLVGGMAEETGRAWVPGHGPAAAPEAGALQLSSQALREIESNAKLSMRETHRAFWQFYAVARLAAWKPEIRDQIVSTVSSKERRVIRQLVAAESGRELKDALVAVLTHPDAGTLAEDLLSKLDALLLGQAASDVTLVYDGLDTGFDTQGSNWERRRDQFVGALLQVILESRVRNRCVHYKVFLREDVWTAVSNQNKSPMEASKVELRWRPEDLWRMALSIAATSASYQKLLRELEPRLVKPWEAPADTLKRALAPLWGETIERGKRARTPEYIQKRTSDAAGRLFPRTLVQILDTAISVERKKPEPLFDRVLRYSSIRDGIAKASRQRVDDLTSEYTMLSPYLELLKGSEPTGTINQFRSRLSTGWQNKIRKRSGKAGAPGGALHAGPGGWKNVLDALESVGVLGPHTRTGDDDEPRLQVAQLYRIGLGIRRGA